MLIYFHCSNKKSDTVLSFFKGAVRVFGWPSWVRGDYGKENNGIESIIIHHWGVAQPLRMVRLLYVLCYN